MLQTKAVSGTDPRRSSWLGSFLVQRPEFAKAKDSKLLDRNCRCVRTSIVACHGSEQGNEKAIVLLATTTGVMDGYRLLGQKDLLGSHSHRTRRHFWRAECEGCSRQLDIQWSRLRFLRLDGQRACNDSQSRLNKSLSSRASARSQQGNLLSGLEISRTPATNYDWSSGRLRQDNLRSIG